jgi:hypothetical protein
MKCKIINPLYVQKFGRCQECGQLHWYTTNRMAIGKIDAYNIKWKQLKDHQREKHAKDLLQPIDKRGKDNPLFYKAYGNVYNKIKK